jgi:hypothetical protein
VLRLLRLTVTSTSRSAGRMLLISSTALLLNLVGTG